MKVLWVTGRVIGPAAAIVGSDYNGTSGGWIQTEFEKLDQHDLEIYYLSGVKSATAAGKNKNVYCIRLPRISNGIAASAKLLSEVEQIIKEVSPDIIHLWGTETCLQDAVSRVAKDIPKVVFIQGLIGIHVRYRGGYIERSDKSYVRSIPLRKKMEQQMRKIAFTRQIKIEQNILKNCGNVIVDNDFSRAYCYAVSKNIRFFNRRLSANHCFRDVEWDFDKIISDSIFTVYGGSPDKGLHQLLKAIKLVKRKYPNVLLKVPGPFSLGLHGEVTHKNTSSYEKWISEYIADNNLAQNVQFIGPRSQEEMAEELLKSHVFVNPSCMEVHALSLREAMTVGVPCISSLCGSVAEFLHTEENGLIYRYEEYEMLAYDIVKLLHNDRLAVEFGRKARADMILAEDSIHSMSLRMIYDEIKGESRRD